MHYFKYSPAGEQGHVLCKRLICKRGKDSAILKLTEVVQEGSEGEEKEQTCALCWLRKATCTSTHAAGKNLS